MKNKQNPPPYVFLCNISIVNTWKIAPTNSKQFI